MKRKLPRYSIDFALSSLGTAGLVAGWSAGNWVLGSACGLVGICYAGLRSPQTHVPSEPVIEGSNFLKSLAEPDPNDETGRLVYDMLQQGRGGLLLRPQVAQTLEKQHLQTAETALEKEMAFVPAGPVSLQGWKSAGEDAPASRTVQVDAFYIDRYAVTNRQYRQFIEAGGYEQMSFWSPDMWAAVLDFVDASGQPGPRYWREGNFPEGRDDHPVVGICWHEAEAYARWVGKRLPTDAEWVKAGGWPVPTENSKPLERKYPWGDTMDRTRANLWGSGPATTVSVYHFDQGVSVGGVYQLIGNVWEWTASNFGGGSRLELPGTMKSLRGGAFDTYFDHQATCQFQSGDAALARKHNIGFRCALSACDVAPPRGESQPSEETST